MRSIQKVGVIGDIINTVEFCSNGNFQPGHLFTNLPELPEVLDKHWEWTTGNLSNAEMMSSKLQGQWMVWMAEWIAPKRGQAGSKTLV